MLPEGMIFFNVLVVRTLTGPKQGLVEYGFCTLGSVLLVHSIKRVILGRRQGVQVPRMVFWITLTDSSIRTVGELEVSSAPPSM